jgi:outer membrane receptor protein involved in Fe transport
MSKKTRRSRAAAECGHPFRNHRSVERLAIGGLCLAALAAPVSQALAQDTTGAEEITVTGSRLRRDGMTTPTPVTAVTNDEMRMMAPTLLMDSLVQMPQFRDNAQSQTGSIFTSGGGSNSVNLRGIGPNRTLTLLDGRRVVSSQQAGTIDIAMFPTALIERVEIVTGGASAAYGSDAISGVTNFILNTDFEGVSGNLQTGETDRHDHQSHQAEFAYGRPIGEKGHLVASFDWYDADGVLGMQDRDWYTGRALFTDSANVRPRRFYGDDGRSRAITPGGLIPSGPLAFTQFIDGQPVALTAGSRIVGNTQIGGGGVDPGEKWTSLRPNDTRNNVFGHFKWDFSDNQTGYIQVLKGEHSVESLPSPLGFAPGWGMTIFRDNPYLPASVAQQMDAAGVTSFPYTRLFEQLTPSREVNDETTSVTLGFDGDVGNRLHLSAYYQYGQNIELADYSSNGLLVRTDRFYRALDSAVDPATGRITCRANIPAFGGLTADQEAQVTRISALGLPVSADPESNRRCVPFDPFATEISQQAIDYMTGGVHHRQKIRQDVLDVSLQTELGGGGSRRPISVGGGIAYRDESVFQDAFGNAEDPRRMQDFGTFSSFLNPTDLIPIRGMPTFIRDRGIFYTGNPNNEGPIEGEFDVWEVFGEAIVPVLQGAGNGVDLHLAARYADYEGSGGVWASKVGGDWQINDELRFRATWSRDTRAGSLSERFDTQTGGTNITDPLLPNEPPYVAATTIGGNPNIRPEISDTWTAGVVFQPQWADGLSMSFDLYDISIEDAISQLGGAQIVDRCYLRGVTELCSLIRRSEVGTPFINQIFNLFINVAETHTSGLDFEASYNRQVDWFGGGAERMSVRLFANYLDEASSAFVGEPSLDRAGETSALYDFPRELANVSFIYGNGPFTFNLQTRYRSKTVRDVTWVEGIDIQDNSVGSRAYTNMNLSYDFDWSENQAQIYFYVGNLFDKDPPNIPGGLGSTSGYAGYGDMNRAFDVLGRAYSAGIRVRFR